MHKAANKGGKQLQVCWFHSLRCSQAKRLFSLTFHSTLEMFERAGNTIKVSQMLSPLILFYRNHLPQPHQLVIQNSFSDNRQCFKLMQRQ